MKYLFTLILLTVLSVGTLSAAPLREVVRGRVTDGAGGPLAQVLVHVQSDRTGFDHVVQTDVAGYYIDTVPAAIRSGIEYRVTVVDCQDQWHLRLVYTGAPMVANFTLPCRSDRTCFVAFDSQIVEQDGGLVLILINRSFGLGVPQYRWDFGDGQESNLPTPRPHAYGGPGSYKVTLILTNNKGCDGKAEQEININPNASICNSDFDVQIKGLEVKFTHKQDDPNGPRENTWNYGDGENGHEPEPKHEYKEPGVYEVTHIVSDSACADTTVIKIYVGAEDVIFARIDGHVTDVDGRPIANQEVCLESRHNGLPYRICVHTDANGYYAETVPVFRNEPTPYDISTQDCHGATQSQLMPANGNPTVDFSICVEAPQTCTAGFTWRQEYDPIRRTYVVRFENTSHVMQQTAWRWTFGNGQIYNGQTLPTMVFPMNVPLEVCLTLTTIDGCTDTYCTKVIVRPPGEALCTAAFTSAPRAGAPNTIDFVDLSSASQPIISWTWEFGDGTSSGLQNPSHFYPYNGDFPVVLTIRTQVCTSSVHIIVPARGLVADNSLEGVVTLRNVQSPADRALVFLIRHDAQQGTLTALDTFIITNLNQGRYRFNNLPAGDYLVKVALLPTSSQYANYLPTYYIRALHWSSATSVHLPAPQQSYDIAMVRGMNPGGPGFVPGAVANGANRFEQDDDATATDAVALYPNPASGRAYLRCDVAVETQASITLVNALGQTVFTDLQTLPAGRQEVGLALDGLPTGVYRVRVQLGERNFLTPLMLVR